MKNSLKRVLGFILTCVIALSSIGYVVQAADLTSYGGWFESIYADWQDSNAKGAVVEYKKTSEAEYKIVDNELIRQYSNSARVDIVGVPAGVYDLKITTSSGEVITKTGINVEAYDRSGYAHFNYNDGVGAYNNDGSLKDNALVIYVTDENKDTVTVTAKDGTTVSGIGNILNSRGGQINKNDKGKVTSEVINTNQEIIKKLAQEGTPLVIRIIGKVTAPQGLTAYDSYDYGGTEGDNGFMARMQSGKDITIEGIGYDASIDGWGIHFMCQSANPELGKSFEARNITFLNYPEDALGFEGIQSGSTLTAPVERVWVHNNSFLPGYCANPAESDKAEGDGSCDFKRGNYFTMDYNYYTGCHKTNLIGAADDCLQFHITLHHNYYVNCAARGPLTRNSNIHMYNNYYYKQTDYALNPRASAYIFSEYNNFFLTKNAMTVDDNCIIKSFNDVLFGCTKDKTAVFVDSKDVVVENNSNLYPNFDTNSELSYIPSGNYLLDTDTAVAKQKVVAYAGVLKEAPVSYESVNASIVDDSNIPASAVSIPSKFEFNKTTITSSHQDLGGVVVNATKLADPITITGQGVVFKLDSPSVVTMNGIEDSYYPELYDSNGKLYISAKGQALLPAGLYIIQTDTYDSGKDAYKESKIESLIFESEDTEITTEPPTEATTIGFVPMKTIELNKTTLNKQTSCVVDNIQFSIDGCDSQYIKVKKTNSIKFKTNKNCSLELKAAKYGFIISSEDGGRITYNGKTADSINVEKATLGDGAVITFNLTPGSYKIAGDNSSSTRLYYFTFTASNESDSYYGDADGDDKITATDAVLLIYKGKNSDFVLPIEELVTDIDINKYMDLNLDSVIDEKDAELVIEKVKNADVSLATE